MCCALSLSASALFTAPARAEEPMPSTNVRAVASPSASDRVARMIARGTLLREAGDTLSALAWFRDAISAAPRRHEGYQALGELYLSLDEPVRALEVFETGTRNVMSADIEGLWLGLATTLRKLGQDERALSALRRLHALAPEARFGLEALAEASETRGAFVEALATRRALIEVLSRDAADLDALGEQRARARALELLIGAAERVRPRAACGEPTLSLVRRALARCP